MLLDGCTRIGQIEPVIVGVAILGSVCLCGRAEARPYYAQIYLGGGWGVLCSFQPTFLQLVPVPGLLRMPMSG